MSLYDRAWSPYAAGILIGLLQAPVLLWLDSALGASSAGVLQPALLDIDYVARHVAAIGGAWWQVALLAGICAGAFVSMRMGGTPRQAVSPVWPRALGTSSTAVRCLVAFVGGFVMLFGARLADGCTTGHGLSGTAQFAVGSIIAVASMFAGGIATAMLVLRRI